jgi:hypothetical protein
LSNQPTEGYQKVIFDYNWLTNKDKAWEKKKKQINATSSGLCMKWSLLQANLKTNEMKKVTC